MSNTFVKPDRAGGESYFQLAVGICTSCTMVQLLEEIPRDWMFHDEYPYRSSGSAVMREHFGRLASELLATELSGPDSFAVEIGCNDGIMLAAIARAGVRHLGVDPSSGAAEAAGAKGIRTLVDFFEESTAQAVRAADGPADVIFSANTFSHISYIDSVLRGVDALLAPKGLFIFEDRYLGDIVEKNYFDQIYDEHFYLFSVHSVRAMAERFGFELIDAQLLPVHGGSIRYVVARPGTRAPSPELDRLLARERAQGLAEHATYLRFGAHVEQTRDDLVTLLERLAATGKRVVGYGATAKSSTIINYCGIGPGLISQVYDSTPEKQGMLTPGSHIPVRPPEEFAQPYPDYAVLFAWNHAKEIMAKEREFTERGGQWILYVPKLHIVGADALAA